MKTPVQVSVLVLVVLGLAGCANVNQASVDQAVAATELQVYAAGSLRGAITVIAKDYEVSTGQKVALTFGASGLLREQIEKGEAAQVFASADTDHPQRLAQRGGWQVPTVFVRNTLCALTGAHVITSSDALLDTMLQSDMRLGTSTPKSDPSGDYTWEMFHKANLLRPGALAKLDTKAHKLVGQTDSLKPPDGRLAYAWIMDQGQVDIFLTYCTNAVAAQKEVPRLKVVQLPSELRVGATYGVTVRNDASPAAREFVRAMLDAPAQAVFSRFGFGQP
jgi:molybdenum ABC transporter molybdate-binding protein